jgi:hypothetical protein
MIDVALRTAAVGLWALFVVLVVLLLRRRRRARAASAASTAAPTPRRTPTVRPAALEDPLNTHTPPQPPESRYAELAREYAAEGRDADAALAQWAADLHVVGPLLDSSGPLLCAAQDKLAAAGPRAAVADARAIALELVNVAGSEVPPLLAPADHLRESATGETRGSDPRADVNELLARAEELMTLARQLEKGDPEQARDRAREADLASFEALLLESALTYGDRELVSAGLRRDLAGRVLRQYDESRAAGPVAALDTEIDRVRGVLRGVVEPHELEALDAAFAAGSAP